MPRTTKPARKLFQAIESLEPRTLFSTTPAGPVIRTWVNPTTGKTVTSTCYMCQYLDPMMPDSAATSVVVKSGNWSDPSTWSNGQLPGQGAQVLIPAGMTETLDEVDPVQMKWIHVYGTLQFATNVNTGLDVETLWTDDGSTLTIGTAASPIAPNVTATVTFADTGATDRTWDPMWLSRGLLAMGFTTMYGAAVTPYVSLLQPATAGNTDLYLSNVPTGWKAGDTLVLGGTTASANQDEQLTIQSIQGNDVKVTALKYNHLAPNPSLSVYLVGTTRNIVFQSQNTAVDRRGDVMFMDMPTVNINYVAFDNLGRTDKSKPINDPVLDSNGQLVAGTGTNPRARYACHFHLIGTDPTNGEATVTGCSVVGSPGWGYDNHGSYVDFEDNTAYDVYGSAFVTERGDEIGTFNANLAIRGIGDGTGIVNENSRRPNVDYGHEGEGFWFQGANISVTNNIAIGEPEAGFVYYPLGGQHFDHTTGINIAASNLVDPSIANGASSISVEKVPVRLFFGNITYASGNGLEALYVRSSHESVFQNFTSWNTLGGFSTNYDNNLDLVNSNLLGNINAPSGTAISRNGATQNVTLDNDTVVGWVLGWDVPDQGANFINGGTFQNVTDFLVTRPTTAASSLTLDGKSQLQNLSASALAGQTQYQFYLDPTGWLTQSNLASAFIPETITFTGGAYAGEQLYSNVQAAGYVPFPAGQAQPWIPSQLVGKTNAQLMSQYGLAAGSQVAPANAVFAAGTNGLIGAAAPIEPPLYLYSREYTNQVNNYQLVYKTASGQRITDPIRTNLSNGWNLLTRTINGQTRTFAVYGEINPPVPTFVPAGNHQLNVTIASLANGFWLVGTFDDAGAGPTNFGIKYTAAQMQALPILTRSDGSKYVVLPGVNYTDAAGTVFNNIPLELTVR